MTRTVEFRYKIIRNGADYGVLHPAAGSAPQISMRETDAVKTSFSGMFLPPEKEVNWLTDEIRPEIIINGTANSLGIFCPFSVNETDDGTMKTISVSANDRCWTVRDCKTERRVYLAAGTNYVDAVISLISEAGIAAINASETDAVLTEDREDWEIGTSYLDIANQLLSEINYDPIWFDADGICTIQPTYTPTAANIRHTLDEHKIESLLIPGIESVTDLLEKANVFVCVCSNADKSTPMRAVAENTNPQSPLSIARRGRRITEVIRVNNIASQEALQTMANKMVTDSMMLGEVLTVNTCLLPGWGVGDVTAIHYGELMAICRETAWTMDLTIGGRMMHTLERKVMALG